MVTPAAMMAPMRMGVLLFFALESEDEGKIISPEGMWTGSLAGVGAGAGGTEAGEAGAVGGVGVVVWADAAGMFGISGVLSATGWVVLVGIFGIAEEPVAARAPDCGLEGRPDQTERDGVLIHYIIA